MRAPQLLRVIYALSLLGAATTHVATLISHGLSWDYGGAPTITRVFWTSLTVVDPLAALLLFAKPRIGVILTLAIIICDVAHNTWVGRHMGLSHEYFLNWMYVSQVLFLVFILLTFRAALKVPAPTPIVARTHAV